MSDEFDWEAERGRSRVVSELGLRTEPHGDGLRGFSEVTPEMFVPGTEVVRTSVLVVWADSVTGLLAGLSTQPRISVTLDLDLHLRHQPVGTGPVRIDASIAKLGRNIIVLRAALTFRDEPQPFAVGHASFMASPDPDHVVEGGIPSTLPWSGHRLPEPLAERAGATRLAPGEAVVPFRPGNLNATGAIQGGMVALAIEEAALSLAPGDVMTSLTMRYLRPFRADARARAEVADGVASVEVEADGRLATVATARLAPAGHHQGGTR